MIPVLGGFLLVLIGVELLDTIKAYFLENAIHVEIVVLLAIIAIARKVILLDPTGMSGFELRVRTDGDRCHRCRAFGRVLPDQESGDHDRAGHPDTRKNRVGFFSYPFLKRPKIHQGIPLSSSKKVGLSLSPDTHRDRMHPMHFSPPCCLPVRIQILIIYYS